MMATRKINNVKLGIFVLTGLLVLIISLYMIGKDTNMFGRNYTLRARFENVQGLTAGHNIRFSGIQVGTVKKVKILADTLIEVTMLIDEKMKQFIHKNDVVSLSTDGLMGNHILVITPSRDGSPLAEEGDLLVTRKPVTTDDILATLDQTTKNIAVISDELKITVTRINDSKGIWQLLEDEQMPASLRASVANIRRATAQAGTMANDLQSLITDIKNGKGSLGAILTDTTISYNLNEAALKIQQVGDHATQLADELTRITTGIQQDINTGKGPAHAILKDSALVERLAQSLSNLEKGTDAFNQNMEALKHNFLLRGYFRRLEKKQRQEAVKNQ